MIVAPIVLGLLLLLAGYLAAPSGQVVHAARTKEVLFRKRTFPMAGIYRAPDGSHVLRDDRILGRASGDSCASAGIRDGDVVVARKMNDAVWDSVVPGDVVMIDAPVDGHGQPLRLRIVSGCENGQLTFKSDSNGLLAPQDRDHVVGKVEMAGN